MTPLMYAAQEGYPAMVQYLLAARASMQKCEEDGLTPLHFAAMSACETTCRVLLDAGADIEIRDDEGKTAFEHVPDVFMRTPRDKMAWRELFRLDAFHEAPHAGACPPCGARNEGADD